MARFGYDGGCRISGAPTMRLSTLRFGSVSQLLFGLAAVWLAGVPASAAAPDSAETRAVMHRVFTWQVANPWSSQNPIESNHGNRGWVQGAFLTGVMEAYRATGDKEYLDYARATAEANSWKLGPRPLHADDHVVAQTYLELLELSPDPKRLEALQAGFATVMSDAQKGRELWWWCDALYMAPPALAKLAMATGEARYLEAMDRWFWDATDAWYDPAESLFYRDARFVAPKDGKKVFWSRGNGWVFGGLARLLDVLPQDHPSRPRYVELFRAMAKRLVALQPADGLWRADLLRPADQHGEASGSAFHCYGLAWGINRGLLPADEYRPAVDRAWRALVACVQDSGKLGWVQPIGYAPDAYDANTSQEYGAGAFLAAGGQILQLR